MKKKREERDKITSRIIELKGLKLQQGGLSLDEQIEYDRLQQRLAYFVEFSNENIAKAIKKIGYQHGQ